MDEIEEIRKKKIKELMEKIEMSKIDKPIVANSKNFDEIVKKYKNVVVDFWAEWCMPCRMIAPIIEDLAREYAGKVVFVKLNTGENPEIAMRYGISAIPTLMFFKNGKPIDLIIGAYPKSEIKRWIDKKL